MRNILTVSGAGMLLLIIGHVHAGEITCPGITQIHRDIGSIDVQDDHEWENHSIVEVANSALEQFNGAEFAIHEPDVDNQTPTRATITCKYGAINLTLEYLQVQERTLLPWADNRCESPDIKTCRLISADDFRVSF
ncbi:hypothetical protein SAMN03159488_03068 [Pseudomonas sp. NFIX10]|uniref:DUF3757 domain-containing protein n=1 Tax=unclassified Pseudomonas TaxID=196821 RepID=UPI0008F3E336|nr:MULTISPECIES: DUF3757 domain-containing protein [unclassified Pseudomonas]SFB33045.1 hypothetical protein SAMN03159488_03068 [Pseudomonas sp. NFIX10]SFE99239.1 hypothetical protein SAMN03159367_02727 [Pseudomonas sp. NFACC06-1]